MPLGGDVQLIADALSRRGAILKQREADEGLNRIAAALKSRGAILDRVRSDSTNLKRNASWNSRTSQP
jgi:hypothetical protein